MDQKPQCLWWICRMTNDGGPCNNANLSADRWLTKEVRRECMTEQQSEKNPVVEQMMATVDAEFGERLDEAGREKIRTGIERNRTNAAALAKYGLANGDEPGTVFRAYRGE